MPAQGQATSIDVTIVSATRNRPALLKRALDSVARQTLQSYEVFVVDDGSDSECANAYQTLLGGFDSRFHLLQPSKPGEPGMGPAAARNRGVQAGQGRYVAFLDDDDCWICDDHLRAAVETLDRLAGDLYCADMQGFRGEAMELATWFPDRSVFAENARVETTPPTYQVSRAGFVRATRQRVVHVDMIVASRRLFVRAGGFLTRLRFAEDYELVMRLADLVEHVLVCDRPVARYRLPEGDSISLLENGIEQDLQMLAAAQHVVIVGQSPDVRSAARDTEAWTLRSLSRRLQQKGRSGTAVALAFQALVTRPTLGGLLQVVRAVLPSRPTA